MNRERVFITLAVCATVVLSSWIVGRAGDLNPPPGPIQPTMRTLNDIYNAVLIEPTRPCCDDSWRAAVVQLHLTAPDTYDVLIAPGSGVLRYAAMTFSGGGAYIDLYDGPPSGGGQLLWKRFDGGVAVEPRIRFTNGAYLYVYNVTGGSSGYDLTVHALYR